jgi:primosomal protein N'
MNSGKGTNMYVVEAAPLSKSPLPGGGILSYFSGAKLAPGALVEVNVRNSSAPALVLSSRSVRDMKSEIRRAGFALRKIRKTDISSATLTPATLAALKDTAAHYVAPLGLLAAALVPKILLKDLKAFLAPDTLRKPRPLEAAARETLLLQMESEERFGQYRALVRQSFARNASLLFVVPTHLDALKVYEELARGVSEFVYVLTLEQSKKEFTATWKAAHLNPHPVLIVTTPSSVFVPRADIDTLVLERVNSRAYRLLARPYIDLRFFLERLALHKEWRLVMGDSVLPIETLSRIKGVNDNSPIPVSEMSLIRWRLLTAPAHLVDASTKQDSEGRFEIFSPELKELLARALADRQRVFLFGARKGLAPTTVCGDCGTVLACKNCGAPVVLHKRGEETIYVCHACSATRESLTACGVCGNWRLVPLGIGIEEVAKQAKLLFPEAKVLILDKDHAPTDTKALAIAEQFKKQGGILVGTELAFYHLDKVPYAAAVSLDALFSLPDFHASERIFYLVNRLREMATQETLIQTRRGTAGNQILAWATQGNIIDFYQHEVSEREALSYPPFSLFIKIEGRDKEAVAAIRERFAAWNPDVYRNSLIIRVPRASWPDQGLTAKLALLGPAFSVKVEPESIL